MKKQIIQTSFNVCNCEFKHKFQFCALMDNRMCYRYALTPTELKAYREEQRRIRAA